MQVIQNQRAAAAAGGWTVAGLRPLTRSVLGVCLLAACGFARADPSAANVADWSRGVWQSFSMTFISGFRGEDEYQDPKAHWTNPPPLTPQYAKRYNEIRQAAFEGRNTYDQGVNCGAL